MRSQARGASGVHLSGLTTTAVVAGCLALAGVQYVVAKKGMQATDDADGLQGIGTAARFAAIDVSITLASLLVGARLLGVKHWILAGLVTAAIDLGLLLFLFRLLNADSQHGWAGAFAFAVAILVPVLLIWWEAHPR